MNRVRIEIVEGENFIYFFKLRQLYRKMGYGIEIATIDDERIRNFPNIIPFQPLNF